MNYEFPFIRNISDVLPAIEGRDEFVVAEKEGYTVINYNVMMADTFPDVVLSDPDRPDLAKIARHAMIRRECRGIIFDTATGDIIRRPLAKFFNINERDETQLCNLDFSKEHWVDTKLDGSMIAVFMHEGELVYGTKMVAPDFHDLVKKFVDASDMGYETFCRRVIVKGYTPIFEFMHPQKRIVIDYGAPALTLLAVRHMVSGQFHLIREYNIPIVEQHGSVEDPKAFMQYVHELKNAEGFVIRWADGHRVKIKAHEYIQIHKAKEAILQDRNIVELILDDKLDDIKAHLPAEDRDRLTKFESDFNVCVGIVVQDILDIMYELDDSNIDRKTFAVEMAPQICPYMRPIIFKNFDGCTIGKVFEDVRNTIRNNLGRTAKYEAIRTVWFPGIAFNA